MYRRNFKLELKCKTLVTSEYCCLYYFITTKFLLLDNIIEKRQREGERDVVTTRNRFPIVFVSPLLFASSMVDFQHFIMSADCDYFCLLFLLILHSILVLCRILCVAIHHFCIAIPICNLTNSFLLITTSICNCHY